MKLNRTPEKIGAGRIPKKQAGKVKTNLPLYSEIILNLSHKEALRKCPKRISIRKGSRAIHNAYLWKLKWHLRKAPFSAQVRQLVARLRKKLTSYHA